VDILNIIFVIYIYNRSNIHIAIHNRLIIHTLLELHFIYLFTNLSLLRTACFKRSKDEDLTVCWDSGCLGL